MADKRKLQGKHGGRELEAFSFLVCQIVMPSVVAFTLHLFSVVAEIDRCLKKITEGVETFEDIWQKVLLIC